MKSLKLLEFSLLFLVLSACLVVAVNIVPSKSKKSISKQMSTLAYSASPSPLTTTTQNLRNPTSIPRNQFESLRGQSKVNVTNEFSKLSESTVAKEEDLLQHEISIKDFDQETQQNFELLFSMEDRERDFLLKEVGLSPEHYHTIQHRRELVRMQLQEIDSNAAKSETSAESLRKIILADHVYWMQNTIGVGNYYLLQEISLQQN